MDNHLLAKIGQYALIKNSENRLLLLQRNRSGEWSLPGGRLEKGEEWDKALIRELQEEINLKCINPIPIAVNILEDPYQIKYCVYFKIEVLDIENIRISKEHKGYKWINTEEINALNIEDEKIKNVIINYLTH